MQAFVLQILSPSCAIEPPGTENKVNSYSYKHIIFQNVYTIYMI